MLFPEGELEFCRLANLRSLSHRLLISFWTVLHKPCCLLLGLGIQQSDSPLFWGSLELCFS